MANIDLHDLRMQEFPHNVRLALNKLDVCSQNQQTPQLAAVQQRIINEFIFPSHESNKLKNNLAKVLNLSINELILVRILSEHLSNTTKSRTCNSLMQVLFHPSFMTTTASSNQQGGNSSSVNPYDVNNTSAATNSPYSKSSSQYMNSINQGNNTTNYQNNPYIRQSSCNQYGSAMNPYAMMPGGRGGVTSYGGGSLSTVSGSGHLKGDISILGGSEVSHRINILSALLSLTVATRNVNVLNAIADWMQHVCSLSGWCGQVCKRLLSEYCLDVDKSDKCEGHVDIEANLQDSLYLLPSLSPLLTANLITCWVQLYARLGSTLGSEIYSNKSMGPSSAIINASGDCQRLPLSLLRLLVHWIKQAPPSLLLTPVIAAASYSADTEAGSALTVIAPFASLLRLCVEAPFFMHETFIKNQKHDSIHRKNYFNKNNTDNFISANNSQGNNQCSNKFVNNVSATELNGNYASKRTLNDYNNSAPSSKRIKKSIDPFDCAANNDNVFGKMDVKLGKDFNGFVEFSEENELYSELFLCLLQAIQIVPTEIPFVAQRKVVCCRQVISIVESLTKLLGPSTNSNSSHWNRGTSATAAAETVTSRVCELGLEDKMEAVNRLAQFVLAANETSCLYGQHGELWTALRRLPIYNRLVNILLSAHQQSTSS